MNRIVVKSRRISSWTDRVWKAFNNVETGRKRPVRGDNDGMTESRYLIKSLGVNDGEQWWGYGLTSVERRTAEATMDLQGVGQTGGKSERITLYIYL